MAKFKVGQKVIYTDGARKQVGLSREVEAAVEEVHYSIINAKDSPPVYTISWPPTGRATVNGREIRDG